jgi:hypothetical protein
MDTADTQMDGSSCWTSTLPLASYMIDLQPATGAADSKQMTSLRATQ